MWFLASHVWLENLLQNGSHTHTKPHTQMFGWLATDIATSYSYPPLAWASGSPQETKEARRMTRAGRRGARSFSSATGWWTPWWLAGFLKFSHPVAHFVLLMPAACSQWQYLAGRSTSTVRLRIVSRGWQEPIRFARYGFSYLREGRMRLHGDKNESQEWDSW
jgi:hypothetical protein